MWVFDPQGIAGERVSWWWDPLSYVRSERHALELADVFALAARDPGARTDAFFDTAGPESSRRCCWRRRAGSGR